MEKPGQTLRIKQLVQVSPFVYSSDYASGAVGAVLFVPKTFKNVKVTLDSIGYSDMSWSENGEASRQVKGFTQEIGVSVERTEDGKVTNNCATVNRDSLGFAPEAAVAAEEYFKAFYGGKDTVKRFGGDYWQKKMRQSRWEVLETLCPSKWESPLKTAFLKPDAEEYSTYKDSKALDEKRIAWDTEYKKIHPEPDWNDFDKFEQWEQAYATAREKFLAENKSQLLNARLYQGIRLGKIFAGVANYYLEADVVVDKEAWFPLAVAGAAGKCSSEGAGAHEEFCQSMNDFEEFSLPRLPDYQDPKDVETLKKQVTPNGVNWLGVRATVDGDLTRILGDEPHLNFEKMPNLLRVENPTKGRVETTNAPCFGKEECSKNLDTQFLSHYEKEAGKPFDIVNHPELQDEKTQEALKQQWLKARLPRKDEDLYGMKNKDALLGADESKVYRNLFPTARHTLYQKKFNLQANKNVHHIMSRPDEDGRDMGLIHITLCKHETPPPSTPPAPKLKVRTEAQALEGKLVGKPIHDLLIVDGEIPEGAYATVDLFYNQSGEAKTCSKPVWTSAKVMLNRGAGEYATGSFTTKKEGLYHFRENVFDRHGKLIAQGKCGEDSETVKVEKPGTPPPPSTPPAPKLKVRTEAQALEGKLVGKPIHDLLIVEGTVPEGAYATVDLFYNQSGEAKTCSKPVWTSAKVMLNRGAGEYATGSFTTKKEGLYHFRENVFDRHGKLIAQGKCGEDSETVKVEKPGTPPPPSTPPTPGTPPGTPPPPPSTPPTPGTPPSTPPAPKLKVRTEAQALEGKLVGKPIHDLLIVEGTVPEGAYATVDLFYNQSGEMKTCGKPIWTSSNILLTRSPWRYATNPYVTTMDGQYHFRESVFDRHGKLIAQGKCGEDSETVKVEKPRRVWTVAQAPKGKHVGDPIHDLVYLEGAFPKDSYVVVKLFYNQAGEAKTCQVPVWTSEKLKVPPFTPATLKTGEFKTRISGQYHFQETVYDGEGKILAQGDCGADSETLVITPDYPPVASNENKGLATTGMNPYVGSLSLVLLAAGGVTIWRVSKIKTRHPKHRKED
ncbi:hypothetical protein F4555_000563 [Mobiluncus mulieris]|uniref:hypothetical protein n=1 Tax=Mobiluncus mulieris TaxID=2052 RepID=UPI000E1C3820|nr:hypothetical protein [Mobiluncus mulieris]MBB5845767.1 hypothetical protein [Mobiluncus mulieris]